MTENEIGDAMRRLPRATASPRFTSEVLTAIRARRVMHIWRFAASTAMVLIVAAGLQIYAARQRQHRLESLRAERQRIETELQQIKVMADQSKPVVVLESGDARLIVNRNNPKQSPQLFYY